MTNEREPHLPRYPFERGPFGSSSLVYDRFRASSPVTRVALPSGWEAWLVTRYADICTVHRDPRFSRAKAVQAGASLGKEPSIELLPGVLQNVDGESHSRLRAVFANFYDPANVPRWAAVVKREANEAIDKLGGANMFDLRADIFEPVARQTAKKLFGLALADGSRILEVFFDEKLMAELHQRIAAAIPHDALPGDSFLHKLRSAALNGGLSEAELLANLMVFATVTFEAIGSPFLGGIFAMLRNPSQWEACVREPSLVPKAVCEMLRCYPNGDGQFLRLATSDVAIHDVTIRGGQAILAPAAAANMDPQVFPNPRSFDVRRHNSNKHIAFGFGTHHCLGSHLVETWMRSVLSVIINRLPCLELGIDPSEIVYLPHPIINIIDRLPVRHPDVRPTILRSR